MATVFTCVWILVRTAVSTGRGPTEHGARALERRRDPFWSVCRPWQSVAAAAEKKTKIVGKLSRTHKCFRTVRYCWFAVRGFWLRTKRRRRLLRGEWARVTGRGTGTQTVGSSSKNNANKTRSRYPTLSRSKWPRRRVGDDATRLKYSAQRRRTRAAQVHPKKTVKTYTTMCFRSKYAPSAGCLETDSFESKFFLVVPIRETSIYGLPDVSTFYTKRYLPCSAR